jgi:hypothetical protein
VAKAAERAPAARFRHALKRAGNIAGVTLAVLMIPGVIVLGFIGGLSGSGPGL